MLPAKYFITVQKPFARFFYDIDWYGSIHDILFCASKFYENYEYYRWTLHLILNENKNATIRHKTCKFPEYLSKGQEWQEGIMLLHNVFETPTLALVCIMDMTSCSFLMQSCVQGYYDKCDIKIYKTLPIWPRARTLFKKCKLTRADYLGPPMPIFIYSIVFEKGK